MNKTLLGLVKTGETVLEAYGIENPRLESEILLSALLKGSRLDLYLRKDDRVDFNFASKFEETLNRRGTHEPVQYITGQEFFLNRPFSVGPGVLIPRPETEGLVQAALNKLEEGPFLDLGTGSGCIAISILLEHQKYLEGYAIDISPAALSFARTNSKSFGLTSRLHIFEGNLFQPLPQKLRGSFEVIVSNPPYLDLEADEIDYSVRKFEPMLAINGGAGGLDFYRSILEEAGFWLVPGGYLILELGINQLDTVSSLMKNHSNWNRVDIARDEQGIARVLTLAHKGSSLG
ncbi:MAG: peptide chain release factor N(5)-glutamine methyltransferase [Nitrospiria bacterium]